MHSLTLTHQPDVQQWLDMGLTQQQLAWAGLPMSGLLAWVGVLQHCSTGGSIICSAVLLNLVYSCKSTSTLHANCQPQCFVAAEPAVTATGILNP
jgi:hypothetical protein